jgi:hypothetical protein
VLQRRIIIRGGAPPPCARLCHSADGELEQIQFLFAHASFQTTEKYLGCKQRLREAVSDQIGIEPGLEGNRENGYGDRPSRLPSP